jgi:hypothetical protein
MYYTRILSGKKPLRSTLQPQTAEIMRPPGRAAAFQDGGWLPETPGIPILDGLAEPSNWPNKKLNFRGNLYYFYDYHKLIAKSRNSNPVR